MGAVLCKPCQGCCGTVYSLCCAPKDGDPFPPSPTKANRNPPPTKPTDKPPVVAGLDVERRVKDLGKRRTDCRIRDAYKLGRTLGTGGFATVKLATDKQSGEQFAVKIMTLPPEGADVSENENTRSDIFKEIEILCGLQHKNVVYLKEFFEDDDRVYLITELLTGGEVLDAVLERGQYSEADARLCFVQLLEGIAYLHSKRVAHRDLKLENLLLATPDDITLIKIADFGLAKLTGPQGKSMETICGTPQYVAPEVIQGVQGLSYGFAVDMWSAGVVLFILLGGYPPFHSENEPKMFEQIRRGDYNFDEAVWDLISEPAKDLISKLLVVDPNQRLTAEESLKHPWLAGEVSHEPLAGTQQNLKKNYAQKFKKAVNVIMTINKLKKLTIAEEDSAKEASWGKPGGN